MTIGEKILELRTAKHLSQGDLANLLDVSRQSISKWETDTAVPDLDKLIRMADLFEVTLDELTGRTPPQTPSVQRIEVVTREARFSVQSIVGLILLGASLLLGIILLLLSQSFTSLLIPLPLQACGILCLCVQEKVWYWCLWVVAVTVEIFVAAGPVVVGLPFYACIWLARLLLFLTLFLLTHRIFRKESRKVAEWKLALGWVVWLLAEAGLFFLVFFRPGTAVSMAGMVLYFLLHAALTAGLAVFCSHILRKN